MSNKQNNQKQPTKPTKEKYWYVTQGLLILLAIVYLAVFYTAGIAYGMYALLAFGLVSIAIFIVMFTQKHFVTMLVDAIFALIIVLHFVSKFMV